MGFFDDLVMPDERAAERTALLHLRPPQDDDGRYEPAYDWFVPHRVPRTELLGAGPHTKVLLTGWSVWPGAVTLHLAVHRRTRWQEAHRGRQSGLRVGLRFADGRRVTSLDAPAHRYVEVVGPAEEYVRAMTVQATGLIPLDPGHHATGRSLFRTHVDLYLAELPPPGEAQLVVEWPDEDIAETATVVDTAVLHEASTRAFEVWPDLEEPDPARLPGNFAVMEIGGPPGFLAPPLSDRQRETLRREEEARQRYVPRPDWDGMGYEDWKDARLVRVRLEAGAPPGAVVGWNGTTPLHLAAEAGTHRTVSALLTRRPDVDARDGEEHTPLWYAACGGDEGTVRALIDAGADVWTPQTGPWSPGRLLLTTPLAPLVADLPGAVPLPEEDAAAFRAADALIAAFGDQELWTEGLGICFVADLGEDEVIRRLGGDPARCPSVDLDNAPFAPGEYDESGRYLGVRGLSGTPGGCVVLQDGYLPSDDAVLRALTPNTTAYGIYFNPKGGTFGTLARDGEIVLREEIGLPPGPDEPPAYWHFRFWQRTHSYPHYADVLAYACGATGLRIDDGRAVADRDAPRRWVELPEWLRG